LFGSRKAEEPAGPLAGPQGVGVQVAAPQSQDAPGDAGSPRTAQPATQMPNMDQIQCSAAIAVRQPLAFAQIISVLMRSPHYTHYTLCNLEWLVLRPPLTGQFSVAEAGREEGGPRFPVRLCCGQVSRSRSTSGCRETSLRPSASAQTNGGRVISCSWWMRLAMGAWFIRC
jgi:hypothetical protein